MVTVVVDLDGALSARPAPPAPEGLMQGERKILVGTDLCSERRFEHCLFFPLL